MTDTTPTCILPPADNSVWAPPLDARDLTVRLEAAGITASVARSQYGFHDVWSMADAYLSRAQNQKPVEAPETDKANALKDYFKGMAFAVPLISCCLVVLLLKVSLWGGSLTANEAAAIAIATIASFVVTGGFVQVIGRQGHFYKESQEWSLCARCCWWFVKAGLLALLGCAFGGLLANAYFRWLPLPLFGWCAAFHIGIGAYLLISGVLYVLDAELLLALGTILGSAIVVTLHLGLRVPLLISQIAGMSGAVCICVLLARFRFRSLGGRTSEPVRLPPMSRFAYVLWPYFIYGCAYYLFLFADRIIAWSARTQNSSLPLQFRGGYETALDICLFAFVLQVGWVHAGLAGFYRMVVTEQRRFRLTARDELKKAIFSFYRRQLLVFLVLFVVATAAVLIGIREIPALQALLVLRVALLALAGIPLLAIGLWNIALLFALARPWFVLAAMGWALLLNVGAGYLLSRLFSYDLAIVGFVLGACVLACATSYFCRRLLSNFEYHYFAATL
jgi:hypothetical protein